MVRRKAVLRRLRDSLAAHGIESVLAGRHVLRLNTAAPWSRSGPVDPELHVGSTGCRCVVTTDGERYQFADGTVHAADDPAGAAGRVVAATLARVIGPGERALRQLIDDGII